MKLSNYKQGQTVHKTVTERQTDKETYEEQEKRRDKRVKNKHFYDKIHDKCTTKKCAEISHKLFLKFKVFRRTPSF